jgi:hypothetical protein
MKPQEILELCPLSGKINFLPFNLMFVALLVKPDLVAEAFLNHFKSVYNATSFVVLFPTLTSTCLPLIRCLHFLLLLLITCRAVKWLKPSKSVGLGGVPGFINDDCRDIFVLKYVFNLSLSQQLFSSLWKHAAVVSNFRKSSSAFITNSPISILSNLSKSLDFVIHDCVCHYFKFKLL